MFLYTLLKSKLIYLQERWNYNTPDTEEESKRQWEELVWKYHDLTLAERWVRSTATPLIPGTLTFLAVLRGSHERVSRPY